jgi:hypothetical protein
MYKGNKGGNATAIQEGRWKTSLLDENLLFMLQCLQSGQDGI